MNQSKYRMEQIVLHWISAIVILWGIITGFYIALASKDPALIETISFINVSLTTIFIPFFILRIFFIIKYGKPALGEVTDRHRNIANIGHILIYTSIIIVLLSGVLMMERPINVFNILEIQQPLHNPSLTSLFNTIHKYSNMVLALLVIGHIAAVVSHHKEGRPVLKRMLP